MKFYDCRADVVFVICMKLTVKTDGENDSVVYVDGVVDVLEESTIYENTNLRNYRRINSLILILNIKLNLIHLSQVVLTSSCLSSLKVNLQSSIYADLITQIYISITLSKERATFKANLNCSVNPLLSTIWTIVNSCWPISRLVLGNKQLQLTSGSLPIPPLFRGPRGVVFHICNNCQKLMDK